MRRLWTLQEAYLSRKIYIPFKEDTYNTTNTNNVKSLEEIEKHLEEIMAQSPSGITHMVKIQLSRMIMGEEKRLRPKAANSRSDEKLDPKDFAAEVVKAYRAARWRVSR
jgi:hypothetical protein